MAREFTLDDFRRETEHLPGDTVIVSRTHNSIEMGSAIVGAHAYVKKMKQEVRHFRDSFDGTNYSSSVYTFAKEDEEGKVVVYVGG